MTDETLPPDVAAVLVDAERALGRHTDRAALKLHARAAVFGPWRTRPPVTTRPAGLARHRLRETLAQQPAA